MSVYIAKLMIIFCFPIINIIMICCGNLISCFSLHFYPDYVTNTIGHFYLALTFTLTNNREIEGSGILIT